MSFIIHYSDGKLIESRMLKKKSSPAPAYLCEDKKTFCLGEIFQTDYNAIAKSNWKNDPMVLNSFKGTISIAYAGEEECIFACDSNDIDILYYYHNNSEFIISDDLWDIARRLEIKFEDINQSWVRKGIISQLINGETVIKNLKILLPSNIGIYKPSEDELKVKEYTDFKYSGEIKSVDEAVERMDHAIDAAFGLMKEKWGADCVYGMGLSGGLDSRVIPHYIKKHNMKLITFNICVKKPHKLLMAASCKNAKKLAEKYDIPFKLIEWNPNSISKKLRLKTKMHPIGTCRNIFKLELAGMPKFDILLSGGYGVLIGDYLPLDIMSLDKKGLIAAIENLFIGMNNSTITFKSRCIKALNYIFHLNIKDSSKYDIEELSDFFKKDFAEARKEVADFVTPLYDCGKYNNIDIFYKYFVSMLCSRDRFGAFESQFGTRRSMTLYMPFVFEETKNWNPELLLDRIVLKELIRQKTSEVSEIATDTFTAAPVVNPGVIQKLIAVLNRVIRGNGTAIDEHYFNNKHIQHEIRKCMNSKYTWFYKILDTRSINKKILTRSHLRMAVAIWEMKYLIDYIESGQYKNEKK